jgi:hypothetical protein
MVKFQEILTPGFPSLIQDYSKVLTLRAGFANQQGGYSICGKGFRSLDPRKEAGIWLFLLVEDFSSDASIIRFWNIMLTKIDAGFAVK